MKARPNIGLLRTTPQFIASTSNPDSGTGVVSVAVPTAALKDDLLVLFVESDGADPAPTVSGWNLIGTVTDPGTAVTRLTVFWKIATSDSEPDASVSDTGDHSMGTIMAFRAAHPTAPIEASNFAGIDTSLTAVTIAGVTTLGPNRMIVYAATDNQSANTDGTLASGWTNANLASITEGFDFQRTAGLGGGEAGAYGVKVAQGATGNTTATYSNGSNRAQCAIAIKGLP